MAAKRLARLVIVWSLMITGVCQAQEYLLTPFRQDLAENGFYSELGLRKVHQ